MNQLESLGIDTLVLEPRSLEQIAEQVKSIGQRLGTEAKAEPRSQRLRAQADALAADRTFPFLPPRPYESLFSQALTPNLS